MSNSKRLGVFEKNFHSNHELKSVKIHPFLYYHKETISHSGNNTAKLIESKRAIQIIFTDGTQGIGTPLPEGNIDNNENENSSEEYGFVITADTVDNIQQQHLEYRYRRAVVFAFTTINIINALCTCLLFYYGVQSDQTAVQKPQSSWPPSTSQAISSYRSNEQVTSFIIIIVILIIGQLAVTFEHILGLSLFCLGIALNFVFSIPFLPFFLYSVRYILDFILLYFAMALRSKLFLHFIHVQTHYHQ